ncbi:MBL fold metallo-hydrolase [Pontimicrobium sp. SW4]|uniref:MBL fold metallo-hydrolase n=1 Tax=Pontimicrobium sp. SW4 TaxID=3153519 RepID=A0AAU7BRE2_9FLAO
MKNYIIAAILGVFLLQSNCIIAQKVKIQYLANEGVLVKYENTEILIDAIFDKEFDYLDVLPDNQLEKLKKAEAPYSNVDIVLSTHLHGDHFNAQLVGHHLKYNTKARFLGPNETANQLKENFDAFQTISSQVTSETPNFFESKTLTLNNVKIKVLRFEHAGDSPWKEAENVAYLITIGGKKILHLGDSNVEIKRLKAFNLGNENIDVVILPYWLLGPSQKENIIVKYINPKQLFVAHIPLKAYSKAQDNITSMGYTNAVPFIEQFKTFVID